MPSFSDVQLHIVGDAKDEPGIHLAAHSAVKWIPGSRQGARPGMTTEGFTPALAPSFPPVPGGTSS